jgi:hypothetical protein
MIEVTLEKDECMLLIINIQNLTKLDQIILSDMECFYSVVFIEYILILMISMQAFFISRKW